MPLKLVLRKRAQNDLYGIVRLIAKRSRDPETARRFGDRLFASCKSLVDAPGKGAPYQLHPGIRKINEGAYKIFYRVTETKIVILRIWDGRREYNPLI